MLAKILAYQGWRDPIKVSKRSGKITAGHGRKLAAIYMGEQQVPVVYQDYKSEDQEYASLISDNTIARQAIVDFAGINADVPNLGPDFDIEMLGMLDFKIDPSEKDFQVDDVEKEEPKSKQVTCPMCDHKFKPSKNKQAF